MINRYSQFHQQLLIAEQALGTTPRAAAAHVHDVRRVHRARGGAGTPA
jgi:hypothetical protein